MIGDPFGVALLCLAAALSWRRFCSIFVAGTGEASLLGPATSVATTVCLTAIGLTFWLNGTYAAMLIAMLSIALAALFRRLPPIPSVSIAALCLLAYLGMERHAPPSGECRDIHLTSAFACDNVAALTSSGNRNRNPLP